MVKSIEEEQHKNNNDCGRLEMQLSFKKLIQVEQFIVNALHSKEKHGQDDSCRPSVEAPVNKNGKCVKSATPFIVGYEVHKHSDDD